MHIKRLIAFLLSMAIYIGGEAATIIFKPLHISSSSLSETIEIIKNTGEFSPIQYNEISKDINGNQLYVNDIIIIIFKDDISKDKIQEILDSPNIRGEIVGYCPFINMYQIRAQKTHDMRLYALYTYLDNIQKQYSDEIIFISPDIYFGEFELSYEEPDDEWKYTSDDNTSNTETADGWDEDNPSGTNWNLELIRAKSAWEEMSKLDNLGTIKVGVIDSGIDIDHEDLSGQVYFSIPQLNEINKPLYHGTHVSGIIGAKRNNNKGISGILDNVEIITYPILPGYYNKDTRTYYNDFLSGTMMGLISTVLSGAKVINYSLGLEGFVADYESNPMWEIGKTAYNNYMRTLDKTSQLASYTMSKLLDSGYDFVVVQSAGNGSHDGFTSNSELLGLFVGITEDNCLLAGNINYADIRNRIISVGSCYITEENDIMQSEHSSGGDRVDICAPGVNVLSTVSKDKNNYGYAKLSGTSMAAPHVTATCAMVWQINPNLSGDTVKDIVIHSGHLIAHNNYSYKTRSQKSEYVVDAYTSVKEAIKTLENTAG